MDKDYKSELKALGVSQVQFAKIVGVSQSQATAWLNGYSRLPEDIKQQLDIIISNTTKEETNG